MSAPAYPQVTDKILLGWLQDAILEPNNGGASLSTNQFTLQQLINSADQAQKDTQRDTGIVAWHSGAQGDTLDGIGVTPNTEQVQLPQDCVDVRRLAWIALSPITSSIQSIPLLDSGDHQHFTVSAVAGPYQYNELFLDGLLSPFTGFYTLSGTNLTLAYPLPDLAVVEWDLQFFVGTGLAFTPLNSGDNQNYFIPSMPAWATTFELFVNGQLTSDGYTLAPNLLTLSAPLSGVLQGFWTYGTAVTPQNSGDSQNFTLPGNPVDGFQLWNQGLLQEPGPTADYQLVGANITFTNPFTAPYNLQSLGIYIPLPPIVNAVTELPRQDSFALDSNFPGWEDTLGTPGTADESLPPIPAINISPQPSDVGQVDIIYTPVPTQLSNTGIPLSFPPDCAPAVFWRAMEIMLSLQGEGADDQRARWANQMYTLHVSLIKSLQFMTFMQPIQGGG